MNRLQQSLDAQISMRISILEWSKSIARLFETSYP